MRKFVPIVFLSALVSTQISCSPQQQPNSKSKVALYSKPAVVRVIANCVGSFEGPDGLYYVYVDGGNGSGFFVNSDGYIATRAVPQNEAECKDKLFDRFVEDISIRGYDAAARLTSMALLPDGTILFAGGPPELSDRKFSNAMVGYGEHLSDESVARSASRSPTSSIRSI